MRRGLLLAAALLALLAALFLFERPPDTASEGVASSTATPPDGGGAGPPTLSLPEAPARDLAPVALTVTPAVDAPVFEAHVRHADGAPAAGSIGVLAHGAAVIWRTIADAEGRLSGEALDTAVTLWIGGATPNPVPFELASARGSHELTLPAGEVIDGHVTVDGGPPPEPFFMGIDGAPRSSQPAPPTIVFDAISPWRLGVSTQNVSQGQLVGTQGEFHFSGLPAGWSGSFEPEYGWYFERYGDENVSAPARGALVVLRRTPRLRLRVLAAGTREPAASAQVIATLQADQASNSHTIVCDADGRAEMPLIRWESAHSVALDMANAAGTQRRVLVVAIPDASHDIDLGDIELERSRTLTFRVQSSAGQPIRGAVAYLEGENTEASMPTGPDGLGRLDNLAPDCTRMRVVAERYEPVSIDLPPQPPPEPIDVTLPGCASIEVRIASADGSSRKGLSLFWIAPRTSKTADAESEVYRHALTLSTGFERKPVSEFHMQSRPDGTSTCDAYVTAPATTGGPFRLGCLQADTPIDVHLLDRSGFTLWSQSGVRLAAGETRELQALIATAPWTASVLVTDAAGAPLAGTDVDVSNSSGKVSAFAYPERSAATNADGRAEIAPLYAPSISLRVALEGWCPVVVEGVAPGAETHVILSRGVSVRLHITDAAGRPVPVEGPWVNDAQGRDVGAEAEGFDEFVRTIFLGNDRHALWQLSNLPPQTEVVVTMRIGGREMSFPLDTRKPETVIALPPSGSVTVKQPEAARALVKLKITLQGMGDDSQLLSEQLRTDGQQLHDIDLLLVFPGDYRVVLTGEEPVSHATVSFNGVVKVEAGKNAVVTPR